MMEVLKTQSALFFFLDLVQTVIGNNAEELFAHFVIRECLCFVEHISRFELQANGGNFEIDGDEKFFFSLMFLFTVRM